MDNCDQCIEYLMNIEGLESIIKGLSERIKELEADLSEARTECRQKGHY